MIPELNKITPESLRALVERERALFRELVLKTAPPTSADVLPPELRLLLDELLSSSEDLSSDTVGNSLARQLAERSVYHRAYWTIEHLTPDAQEIVLPELLGRFEAALAGESDELPAEIRMANVLERLGPPPDLGHELELIALQPPKEPKSLRWAEGYGQNRWVSLFHSIVALAVPWLVASPGWRLIAIAIMWSTAALLLADVIFHRRGRPYLHPIANALFLLGVALTSVLRDWSLEESISRRSWLALCLAITCGLVSVFGLRWQRKRNHRIFYLLGDRVETARSREHVA